MPRYRFGVFWLLALERKVADFCGFREKFHLISRSCERERENHNVHHLCIGLPALHSASWGHSSHGDTFPQFEQTWGEVQTPQSFTALYPLSLVCPIWGPAGISLGLFMRCLSSHEGIKFFKSSCPMSCWKQLGSLLRHLNQLSRGSVLPWCLAKSRKSSRKLGKPHQRDGE